MADERFHSAQRLAELEVAKPRDERLRLGQRSLAVFAPKGSGQGDLAALERDRGRYPRAGECGVDTRFFGGGGLAADPRDEERTVIASATASMLGARASSEDSMTVSMTAFPSWTKWGRGPIGRQEKNARPGLGDE
jgi:hypothetical protein